MANHRSRVSSFTTAGLLALLPVTTMASEREHEAHVHGNATLEVVAEGDELIVGLRVPSYNVVGFEHAPNTDEQRKAVSDALARMRAAKDIFTPNKSAECELEVAEVAFEGMGEDGHDDHDEHDHAKKDEHDHDEHDHAKKDEHDHDEHDHSKMAEHDDHEEHETTHSELHAEYHFHCHHLDKLATLEVNAFSKLRELEVIEAKVVTASVQTAADLKPGDKVLKLSR